MSVISSSQQPPDLAAMGIRVTNVIQSAQPNGQGAFINGYTISYTAPPNGNEYKIFIPLTAYSPAGVAAAIAEQVGQIQAIHNLGK